jgi:acyl-coenzyme A synthetase/AMP-(fatty) acid ligase
MKETYKFVPEDRISETADISFDLSVGNMFMTLEAGASLHIVPSSQMLSPLSFIQQHELTVWFSVPSIISLMRQMRMLKAGVFPTLRYSMFIGEPLPLSCAKAWQEAAPNSIVENLYGPTEATVACTRYKLENYECLANEHKTVAIGKSLFGTELAIVDSELEFQPLNTKGELALSGVQIALGYFKAEEMTHSRFPIINGKRWYLTGDAAMCDDEGVFHHCGRIDNQIKILGYRVELEDIEAHLRIVSGSELAAAIAYPVKDGVATGIVGFITNSEINTLEVKQLLKEKIPLYMIPNIIHNIAQIPLTPNGKIDRKKLREILTNHLL